MHHRASIRLAALTLLSALAALGCEKKAPSEASPAKTPPAETQIPTTQEAPAEAPKATGADARSAGALPDTLPNGLLLAYSQFEVADGKATAKPGPARLDILTRQDGQWKTETIEDPQSNVFHKAMLVDPKGQPAGILTLGGTGAYVKLWRRAGTKLEPTTLWHAEFGGKFDRMRDAEAADLYGDGSLSIAVATHDQGVVGVLRQRGDRWDIEQIDEKKDTFVHEIEIGDLDGDGALEVYATPSEPNKLGAEAQHGEVVRYVPKKNEGRTIVADLGNRHAKEIYVGDVDGDGTDELYVAVEALTRGQGASLQIVEPVEIRRYEAGTDPNAKVVIATIGDRLCRFLTVGDVDGDGKKEMVAASFSKGLWLLRPGKNPNSEWSVESIDRDSGGFEHAALLTDLDADGKDELYVAADNQGELRRYVWVDGRPKREVILERDVPLSRMTWNIMPVPVAALSR